MEASYYRKKGSKIICELCPHACSIGLQESGLCKVRTNINGTLQCNTYGKVSALNMDPIEKKPLFHFYPGSEILSLGSFSCNFTCNFCQNHSISQIEDSTALDLGRNMDPDEIIRIALEHDNNIGIAFTYNEPIVWYEYMYDIAEKATDSGLKTVMISNGFINPAPLKALIPKIDAFNIDLKAFNNNFYKNETGGSLNPVLDSIKTISDNGKHLEITMLVIPGLNDDLDEFDRMTDWIKSNCSPEIVLHLSRYFPRYKSKQAVTDTATLRKMYDLALTKLKYVYPGNISTYDW